MSELYSPIQTAVLFLVFNRPDTTKRVFEAIRQVKPPRLYVAADGPRDNHESDLGKILQVRDIVTQVDWPCDVKTLFRKNNLGCKMGVSSGISWFFEHEEQGIILEDDCLPNPDFFIFCETLLNRYAKDERVAAITGNNFQDGCRRGEASYYFSKYFHCWGWATWRRSWEYYHGDIPFWPAWSQSKNWRYKMVDPVERCYWFNIFERVHAGKFDTWDYPWTASIWYKGTLIATPNVNLVTNIGFGADSTHTRSTTSPLSNMQTYELGGIAHPLEIKQDIVADRYNFDNTFNGKSLRYPNKLFVRGKQFIGEICRLLRKELC